MGSLLTGCMLLALIIHIKCCSTIDKYGVGCQKSCDARQCSCNSTCDQVTGECIGGCRPGYQGIDCSQESTKEATKDEKVTDTDINDKDTILILAIVNSILIVILFIFIIYILIIKYRKYNDTKHADSTVYERTDQTLEHVYGDLEAPKEHSRNASSEHDSIARVQTFQSIQL